jgi:predicted hotdog family 3-hydroxylacyl-ACP dehydratase
MRWIEALTACDAATATATACFREGDFPAAGGELLEIALVECVAQTIAAAQASRERTRHGSAGPGSGMLVAVSNFEIHSPPPLGKSLHIETREIKRLGAMLLISGTVFCDDTILASGELSVYA